MCHAIGGTILFYNRLAFQLEKSICLYGIQAYGIDDRSSPLENIKEIARQYYTELKEQFDLSEVRLGGYSFGCLIILEILKLAESEGITLQKAILISPPSYQKHEPISPEILEERISVESNKYLKQFFKGMDNLLPGSLKNKYLALYSSHLSAFYNYEFETQIDSPLHIICPVESELAATSWMKVSNNKVDISSLDFTHRTILRSPGVKSVAEEINMNFTNYKKISR